MTSRQTFPLAPNPLFVGREPLLQELRARMEGERRVVVLTGMAGVGKTQLAVQFVWSLIGHHTHLRPCFRSWDPHLHPLALSPDRPAMEECDVIVFDHLTSEETAIALKHYLHARRRAALVIITTCRRGVSRRLGIPEMRVPLFSPALSLRYLHHHMGGDVPDEELLALAEKVGHLPAALFLVGRYLQRAREAHAARQAARELLSLPLEVWFTHRAMDGRSRENESPTRHPLCLGEIAHRALPHLTREERGLLASSYLLAHLPPPLAERVREYYLDDGERIHPLLGMFEKF